MSPRARRWTLRLLGAVLAVAVAVITAALSRVPWSAERSERALVRLSWRAPIARVEECRTLTGEELSRLPLHMRKPEVCEGRLLPYVLSIEVDEEEVLEETLLPSEPGRIGPCTCSGS
jgi:hypothetical protein